MHGTDKIHKSIVRPTAVFTQMQDCAILYMKWAGHLVLPTPKSGTSSELCL